jgi:hypothetical protein
MPKGGDTTMALDSTRGLSLDRSARETAGTGDALSGPKLRAAADLERAGAIITHASTMEELERALPFIKSALDADVTSVAAWKSLEAYMYKGDEIEQVLGGRTPSPSREYGDAIKKVDALRTDSNTPRAREGLVDALEILRDHIEEGQWMTHFVESGVHIAEQLAQRA